MALLQPLPLHSLHSSHQILLSKTSHFGARSLTLRSPSSLLLRSKRVPRRWSLPVASWAALPQLDLTEENIQKVLIDARSELGQIFDASVGITGQVDLVEVDGPFVKLSLKGRFWHKRVTVLERIGTYLKNRIPDILEVEIEDEKQLDDSPENF